MSDTTKITGKKTITKSFYDFFADSLTISDVGVVIGLHDYLESMKCT